MFDSRLYHGNFPCRGRIPVVTMVWVVSRFRLKAPPGPSSHYISPLTPSGQRNCASWASQPQKSVTLPPQPGDCINTASGNCHSVLVAVSCAGWEFTVLYMFRACHAHHQEKQIVSIQLLVIVTPCWWQCRVLVGSKLPTRSCIDTICFS